MTREEAIERLKTDIYKYADFTENPNENEFWMAFDMSIKALEQEPCETQMVDKSNFSQEQYKADLQSAYDCGKVSVKPCEDAISIEEAIHCLEQLVTDMPQLKLNAQKVADAMSDLPHVYQEPKTGHWNSWFTEIKGNNTFNCMECGSTFIVEQGAHNMNYCPNCGCRMVEPQESEDYER